LPSLNKIIQAVTIILFLALASCESPVGGGGSSGGGGGSGGGTGGSSGNGVKANVTNSNRYQAIPDNSNDKIKYSYTYGGYDFYYIYLGQLGNIPLFYDDAQRHLWNYSSSTYTWSTTSATTSTVSNAVTQASQETVSVTNEHTVEKTSEYKFHEEINTKFKIFGIGTEVKFASDQNFKNFTSDTTKNSFQKTTSLTNTVEYTTSNTESLKRERSYTLTKTDKEGYYRYTYFSVSDVYLYVIRNPATKEIYYEFREYIVPGKNFWDLDYCETPDFKKSDTTRFGIDISILNNLPATKVKFGDDESPPPPPGDPIYTVTNNGEWNAVLSVIKSGGSGTAVNPKKYNIEVGGDVLVTGSTAATLGAVSNVEVTLKGNGRLYLSNPGHMLYIGSAQTIIIDSPNLTLQGLKNKQNSSGVDNTHSAVYVYTGGTLELKDGTISGNTATGPMIGSGECGGVWVDGNFKMTGGVISGNSTNSLSGGGGGVRIGGDSNTKFTMTGGTISGNTSRYVGGGVCVLAGTFDMTGGAISGNTASGGNVSIGEEGGGGVFVRACTFNIHGGTIYGNDALASLKNTASGSYGHAVSWRDGNITFYRNITVGADVNMSTSDTKPTVAGQTVGAWTRR
ncbi:MAG: hypothetical protein LBB81_07695, partial [Treponema sp.]|nr:hypothetical protein [Treponema sp.]